MENKPILFRTHWKELVIQYWKPQPLALPVLSCNISKLSALQRASSVLRYSLFRLEYWISPRGALREWTRFNLTVAVFAGIPALFIVPIVTFLLWQFATWTEYLVQIAKNLLLFPIMILGAFAVVTAFLCFLRGLLRK